MTNEKLIEMLEKMYNEMQDGFKEVNSKIETMQTDIKDLKQGQERIENKLDDIEAHNADRHIIIGGEIKDMKSDISRIEMNTADNWKDIAKLKSII